MNNKFFYWFIPLALLFVAAALSAFIDMPIAQVFYDKVNHHFVSNAFTDFVFDRFVIPAQILGILAAFAFLLSYTKKSWKHWRKPALLLVLTMVIGAGFITHTVLKDHWGRPRPKQVVEFGGSQEFRPVYKPNFFHQPEPSKSFPCGHCTMGFYFFALLFIGKRLGSPSIYYSGLILSITLGTILAVTRMAQGGHFLSDVISAGAIMWLTAFACDAILYPEDD